ncbi:hypothetical protein [Flavobacterium humidisoli]|uniref:Uncharacterized protein n=1 Tax=Flavobacterium humidisoli TaxID=2937442 RepID=A0ABY4M1U1_9FLAO|nr:hypothetical protein [Flavobacterium humidisoli]UPZ17816.1 hypothetical protein M0M44_10805 [Flavobacterium humidisoli]
MSQIDPIIETLSLLDKSLDYLINSDTLSLHFNELKNKLFNDSTKDIELSQSDNNSVDELFNDIFSKQSQQTKNLTKINEVLLFLETEKLIRLIEQNHIRITYQGIIQHSKGYLNTYNLKKSNAQRLQNVEDVQKFHLKWMTILTSLIAVGTLVASIYYLFELFSVRFCLCNK